MKTVSLLPLTSPKIPLPAAKGGRHKEEEVTGGIYERADSLSPRLPSMTPVLRELNRRHWAAVMTQTDQQAEGTRTTVFSAVPAQDGRGGEETSNNIGLRRDLMPECVCRV